MGFGTRKPACHCYRWGDNASVPITNQPVEKCRSDRSARSGGITQASVAWSSPVPGAGGDALPCWEKIRAFAPLPNLSLEELVPKGNFYRRLEEKLDLSFVRESVRGCYAPVGRPSVDPVVFFKLQLVLFFEGLRSERQLMEIVADRL